MTERADIRTGHCLCGAVTFTATLPARAVQLCHCEQCQRWTGGGALAVVRVQDVDVQGQEHIGTYCASEHGERAFCKLCGTTLFWKMQGKPIAFLPAGVLTDQSGLAVEEEIFVDQRACWLSPHKGAAQHDAAEMNAQLDAYLNKGGA